MKTIRNVTNSVDIMETNTIKVNRETRGNFFVMDSEQVVSNPYQELQHEALDSVKKASLTERLTSVRNNVCEHNLRCETTHLEKQRKHSLRNMHMDSSNLRYEAKIMDINKRRNDLLLQQRIDPYKDFSYDTRQIDNTAKRLGVTNEKSFYLDKELKFPLRGNILKDHNKKPFIKKARKMMHEHNVQKRLDKSDMEHMQTAHTFDRATTALTMSTSVDIPSPEPPSKGKNRYHDRRGSKSAPPPLKSAGDPQRSSSRLNNSDELDSKLPSITNSSNGTLTGNAKTHVKFQVQEPKPFRQSTPNSLHRPQTFHSGMGRQGRSYSQTWDSDSDDDYAYCDKVDLRALFFGNKSQNTETKSTIGGTTTPRTLNTGMSGDIPPLNRSKSTQPVKQEQLIQESKEIRNKIDKFLETLPSDEKFQRKEEKKEEKKVEKIEREEAKEKADIASKAAYLLSVFSKPIDHKLSWGGAFYRPPAKTEPDTTYMPNENEKKTDDEDKPQKQNMWELIRTNIQNGNVHKKYSANDLLLQQLTGILVRTDRKTSIPIHAASRALRHTPTFKMRRVVEELMQQRTRYEQQEVEKLQQQEANEGQILQEEDSGVQQYPVQAWAAPNRQVSQEIK